MIIILLLFIFFIVVPLLSAMYKIWSFRRRVRRFMEDPFGQNAYGASTGHNSRESDRHHRARAKKIPRDVGEYVAFTEYESQTAADSGQASSARKTRTESQITDVEWVDIEK